MLKRNLTILVASVLLLVSTASFAQSKEDLVRELLEITQSAKLATQIVDQMLAYQQQQNASVPATVWTELKKEFKAEELLNLIVPVYMKHFTEDDLSAIIAFYRTPAGAKFVTAMPAISSESMEAGKSWGMMIGKRIAEKLNAETQ